MGNPLVDMMRGQAPAQPQGNPQQSLLKNLLTGKTNLKEAALSMFQALPGEQKQRILGQMQMMTSVGKQYGATEDSIKQFQAELKAFS